MVLHIEAAGRALHVVTRGRRERETGVRRGWCAEEVRESIEERESEEEEEWHELHPY